MHPSFHATLPDRSDALLADYRRHLLARDGALEGTTVLGRREVQCARLDATDVRYEGPIDPALFQAQYHRYRADVDTSQALTALLAFVKINAGEAYGVDALSRGKPHADGDSVKDTTERILLAEEHYHTRLLVGALHHFPGLVADGAWTPAAPIRILVHGLLRCPEAAFYPVLLAAELAGIQAFAWLLDRLPGLFPDQPALRDLLEERLTEIIVDEVGHIAYNRVLVGPGGAAFARWLAPQILRGITLNAPELRRLGLDARERRRLQDLDYIDLPAHVRARAWFV